MAEAKLVTLGERVRAFRKRLKWSQVKLAREARITKPYVSYIESNTRNPTLQTIAAIAKAFGVTVSALLKDVAPEND